MAVQVKPIQLQDVLNILDYARHVCSSETLPDSKEWLKMHELGVSGWNNALAHVANELKRLYMVTDLASNNPEASAELSNPPKDMNTSKSLDAYHLKSCHSRQAWVKGMTEPFPCDCGLKQAIVEAVEGLVMKCAVVGIVDDNPFRKDYISVDEFLQAIKEWQ